MLKRIHIRNFLSCQDTDMDLDGVTALIGRNAAGKTNVLKAVEWCAQFAVGGFQLEKYLPLDRDQPHDYYEIEFLIGDKNFKYERSVTVHYLNVEDDAPELAVTLVERLFCGTENDSWKIIAERTGSHAKHYDDEINIEINAEAPLINSLLSLLPEKKINPDVKMIFNYLSGVRYYSFDNYDNKYNGSSIDSDDYQQWISKSNKERTSVVMRLLHLWHVDKELLEELKVLVGKNGLNLVDIDIRSFKLSPDCHFYMVYFYTDAGRVSYSQLSYGTQRVLAILLALLYDNCSTLLIEQPEDGIHSGLLKKLLPLCFEYGAAYNRQIIIATHSPDVINLVPPESIRLVRMTENGTKVSSLDAEQMPFIYDYIKNEGALFDFIKSMNDE